MTRFRSLILLLVIALSACARAMEVGSEPRPTYRVAVHNELAEPMIVSYADDRGQALLGTVPAGRTEHYVIAAPSALRITITARNAAGTRSVGPLSVQLTAGEAAAVRLR